MFHIQRRSHCSAANQIWKFGNSLRLLKAKSEQKICLNSSRQRNFLAIGADFCRLTWLLPDELTKALLLTMKRITLWKPKLRMTTLKDIQAHTKQTEHSKEWVLKSSHSSSTFPIRTFIQHSLRMPTFVELLNVVIHHLLHYVIIITQSPINILRPVWRQFEWNGLVCWRSVGRFKEVRIGQEHIGGFHVWSRSTSRTLQQRRLHRCLKGYIYLKYIDKFKWFIFKEESQIHTKEASEFRSPHGCLVCQPSFNQLFFHFFLTSRDCPTRSRIAGSDLLTWSVPDIWKTCNDEDQKS